MKLLPSQDTRRLLTLVGVLFVAPPIILVAFILLTIVAGPLVAVLTVVCVGGAVEAMRRYYREYRYGVG